MTTPKTLPSQPAQSPSQRPDSGTELNGWRLPGLDFSSFRISLIAKVMDRLSNRHLAVHTDLSMPEWRVLSRLAQAADGLTVRQIADRAWVDRAEVSRAATALERRGLTARRDNPADRRAPVLFVTDAGLRHYSPVIDARSDFHAMATRTLTASERLELDRLLKKIADELRDMATQDAEG